MILVHPGIPLGGTKPAPLVVGVAVAEAAAARVDAAPLTEARPLKPVGLEALSKSHFLRLVFRAGVMLGSGSMRRLPNGK